MDKLNPRNLTRDQLARFLPSHELIKAFEALFNVAGQTPDAVNTLAAAVETAQESSDTANAAAVAAAAIASYAQALAGDLAAGPTPIYLQMSQQIDDLSSRLSQMDAILAAMSRRINALEERPTP